MAKLNIPKNYLSLTLFELISQIIDNKKIAVIEKLKIHKPDDYQKVIKSINEILDEDYQLELVSVTEGEQDENQWILEIACDETSLEFSILQEEDKIDDRGIVDGINQIFSKLKADFLLFSFWDSEWDSHTIGFGIIPSKSKKQILELMNSRKENDWFELFYISS
jgi:hypothetical protein